MKTCTHCGKPQRGSAAIYLDGIDYPLCHPDTGLDCYHLVTTYKHPVENCDRCVESEFDELLDESTLNSPAARYIRGLGPRREGN